MIVDKLGFYLTRGEEIVKVFNIISPDQRIYVVSIEMEDKTQYTATRNGRITIDREDYKDLVKYLPKEKYPELYL